MKTCKNCGHIGTDDHHFCMKCGAKLPPNPPVTESVKPIPQNSLPQQAPPQSQQNPQPQQPYHPPLYNPPAYDPNASDLASFNASANIEKRSGKPKSATIVLIILIVLIFLGGAAYGIYELAKRGLLPFGLGGGEQSQQSTVTTEPPSSSTLSVPTTTSENTSEAANATTTSATRTDTTSTTPTTGQTTSSSTQTTTENTSTTQDKQSVVPKFERGQMLKRPQNEIAAILPGTWYSLYCEVNGVFIETPGYLQMDVDHADGFRFSAFGEYAKRGKWKFQNNQIFFDDNHINDIFAHLYADDVLVVDLYLGTTVYMVKDPSQYQIGQSINLAPLEQETPSAFLGVWSADYYIEKGKRFDNIKWIVTVKDNQTIDFDIENEPFSSAKTQASASGDRLYIFDYYGINIASIQNGKLVLDIGDGSFVYLKKIRN